MPVVVVAPSKLPTHSHIARVTQVNWEKSSSFVLQPFLQLPQKKLAWFFLWVYDARPMNFFFLSVLYLKRVTYAGSKEFTPFPIYLREEKEKPFAQLYILQPFGYKKRDMQQPPYYMTLGRNYIAPYRRHPVL